jgi:hypothetical protein
LGADTSSFKVTITGTGDFYDVPTHVYTGDTVGQTGTMSVQSYEAYISIDRSRCSEEGQLPLDSIITPGTTATLQLQVRHLDLRRNLGEPGSLDIGFRGTISWDLLGFAGCERPSSGWQTGGSFDGRISSGAVATLSIGTGELGPCHCVRKVGGLFLYGYLERRT